MGWGWTYSACVRVVEGPPGFFTIHVGDPNEIEGTVEVSSAHNVEDVFADLDLRKQEGRWPFDDVQ